VTIELYMLVYSVALLVVLILIQASAGVLVQASGPWQDPGTTCVNPVHSRPAQNVLSTITAKAC
jgi:hypothetical protein